MKSYNVKIKTTFKNGMTSESNVDLSTILDTFKTGQYLRYQEWFSSDDHSKSVQSPYVVKKLEFAKDGKVKQIELKEDV